MSEHSRALVFSAYSYSGVASDLETETVNLISACQSYEEGGKSELLIFVSGVSSYSGQCGSQAGQDPVRTMADVVGAALSFQHVRISLEARYIHLCHRVSRLRTNLYNADPGGRAV